VDQEWAPDQEIKELWQYADRLGVSLFPFVTHRSEYLNARREPMGVHPNFLPGSTHGPTCEAVVEHVRQLVPEATAYRAHCFHDDTRLQWMMREQGFDYDSNACHFLVPSPSFKTAGGLTRFPVYWADDVHFRNNLPDTFDARFFEMERDLVVCLHPKYRDTKVVRQMLAYAGGKQKRFEELFSSVSASAPDTPKTIGAIGSTESS
jgi:hypothetical protein